MGPNKYMRENRSSLEPEKANIDKSNVVLPLIYESSSGDSSQHSSVQF